MIKTVHHPDSSPAVRAVARMGGQWKCRGTTRDFRYRIGPEGLVEYWLLKGKDQNWYRARSHINSKDFLVESSGCCPKCVPLEPDDPVAP